MKRIWLLVAVLACGLGMPHMAAAAEVDFSLNLEFNTPLDFSSGGSWTVVAKADERGIAAALLAFIDSSLNFNPASGFLAPAAFNTRVSNAFGLRLEILEGQSAGTSDPNDRLLDVGVIGGTWPSTYVDDPNLVVFGANPDLGSFTGGVELATGTFDPSDVPSWFDDGNDSSAANVWPNPTDNGILANVSTTVRYVNIPEPSTIVLLSLAFACAGVGRRRR